MNRKSTVTCPSCGAEYLPAEIFYPNSFFGRPRDIVRGDDGKLLGFNGTDMDLCETYICDVCKKKFTVTATMTFKTTPFTDMFDPDPAFQNK